MFVRMKTGRYIGEVREIVFEAARDLIASGQAEQVDFDVRESQTQILLDTATSRRPAEPVADKLPVQAGGLFRRRVTRRGAQK